MKNLLLLSILLFLIFGNNCAQSPAQTIPEFEFSRLDKSSFTNRDLVQNKVIFFIFFDSECEHCQRAVSSIDRQIRSFEKTAIYLVSVDDDPKIRDFVNRYAIHLKDQKNVLLLRDDKNQFIARFKPYRYPAMFLYSAEKKLIDYEDNSESIFRLVNTVAKGK